MLWSKDVMQLIKNRIVRYDHFKGQKVVNINTSLSQLFECHLVEHFSN